MDGSIFSPRSPLEKGEFLTWDKQMTEYNQRKLFFEPWWFIIGRVIWVSNRIDDFVNLYIQFTEMEDTLLNYILQLSACDGHLLFYIHFVETK